MSFIAHDFCGSEILEAFDGVVFSQDLSSGCSHRGWSRYTVGMVKERKGTEQLGGQASFSLHIVSEPLNVVSTRGLIWASSQPGSLRGSWTAYMTSEGFKGEYSSEQGRKLHHFFLPPHGSHTVSLPPHSFCISYLHLLIGR